MPTSPRCALCRGATQQARRVAMIPVACRRGSPAYEQCALHLSRLARCRGGIAQVIELAWYIALDRQPPQVFDLLKENFVDQRCRHVDVNALECSPHRRSARCLCTIQPAAWSILVEPLNERSEHLHANQGDQGSSLPSAATPTALVACHQAEQQPARALERYLGAMHCLGQVAAALPSPAADS